MHNLLIITELYFCHVLNNFAQKSVKWISFDEAIKLNKKDPKPILIDVYTDWCGYCKKMDMHTYSNITIAKYINENFYAVKLDGEEKKDIVYKGHTFKYQKQGNRGYHQLPAALMNGKLSYPTTLFLSETVQILDKIPGYLDKKVMEKVITYFGDEFYKTKKWDVFDKEFKSNL